MNEAISPITGNASQPKTPALAIWSLVLGIIGLLLLVVCIGPLFAIPGVICGHMAYSRIKRSGGALAGEGMALAGLITSYVSIGMIVLMIPLMASDIPNFVKARETAQMNACINNLRQIDAAKQQWALENNKKGTDTPTQSDLVRYISSKGQFPVCPKGGTYTIDPVDEPPTCSIPGHELPKN
jgi:competence protein ComGC